MTSASASSTSRSVSGRGMSARAIDLEGEPVELLEPAQVGDRLAGRAALDVRAVAAGRVGADRRLGMGEDDRSPDTDRVAEQQLGVEPRRLGAGRGEPVGPLAQERAGGLVAEAARRASAISRQPAPSPSPSRSAWSAITSASMRSSRSPSITPGRLWTVLPIRWSVTRSCGKL